VKYKSFIVINVCIATVSAFYYVSSCGGNYVAVNVPNSPNATDVISDTEVNDDVEVKRSNKGYDLPTGFEEIVVDFSEHIKQIEEAQRIPVDDVKIDLPDLQADKVIFELSEHEKLLKQTTRDK